MNYGEFYVHNSKWLANRDKINTDELVLFPAQLGGPGDARFGERVCVFGVPYWIWSSKNSGEHFVMRLEMAVYWLWGGGDGMIFLDSEDQDIQGDFVTSYTLLLAWSSNYANVNGKKGLVPTPPISKALSSSESILIASFSQDNDHVCAVVSLHSVNFYCDNCDMNETNHAANLRPLKTGGIRE
jgi:hypothetical protein